MTALLKTCNKFSKFVNNTEQKRNVCINTQARAHGYMHKYSDEKFTNTQRQLYANIYIYIYIYIYSIKCLMFYSITFEKRKLFKCACEVKDQSILQNKITFGISLVTTKKQKF